MKTLSVTDGQKFLFLHRPDYCSPENDCWRWHIKMTTAKVVKTPVNINTNRLGYLTMRGCKYLQNV